MRLNRYLAACGLGSRRSCEQLVADGRVFVNGDEVRELATQVGEGDVVMVDGRKVKATVETTVILNKPPGFLCTRHDELEDPRREAGIRETVYALLPPHLQSLHYVGRLDKDSEGLLILTNSGELTEKLTHPRFGVEKEYLVALDRVFRGEDDREQLLKGMMIEGGFAKAAAVEVVEPRVVALTLTQGLKRQIRLMFEAIGYRVQRLQRVRIGAFTAPDLKSGRWRLLTAAETRTLLARHTPPRPRPAQARAAAKKAAQKASAAKSSAAGARPGGRRAPEKSPDSKSRVAGGAPTATPHRGRAAAPSRSSADPFHRTRDKAPAPRSAAPHRHRRPAR